MKSPENFTVFVSKRSMGKKKLFRRKTLSNFGNILRCRVLLMLIIWILFKYPFKKQAIDNNQDKNYYANSNPFHGISVQMKVGMDEKNWSTLPQIKFLLMGQSYLDLLSARQTKTFMLYAVYSPSNSNFFIDCHCFGLSGTPCSCM